MNTCMDRWMDGQTDLWMDSWMDRCRDGHVGGWMDRWMDRQTHGWADGQMDGGMGRRTEEHRDGWMDTRMGQEMYLSESSFPPSAAPWDSRSCLAEAEKHRPFHERLHVEFCSAHAPTGADLQSTKLSIDLQVMQLPAHPAKCLATQRPSIHCLFFWPH